MFLFHHNDSENRIAELPGDHPEIGGTEEILDIMVDAGYNDCNALIIHAVSLPAGFFNLSTGIAGEILQKFSNYRMRLAIVGDFSDLPGKSLRDFIRESNRGKTINFLGTVDEALAVLSAQTLKK